MNPRVKKVAALLAAPAVVWIVEGYLAVGEMTVTYGGVKCGKSAYALRLCARLVATNKAFVTYLAVEDYANTVRKAYYSLRAEGVSHDEAEAMIDDGRFNVVDCSGTRLVGGDDAPRAAMESAVAGDREQADVVGVRHLVVVDNLSAGIGEGNQITETHPAMIFLDGLRQRQPSAYLVIHHANSEKEFAGYRMPERVLFCMTFLTGKSHRRKMIRAGGEGPARLGTYQIIAAPDGLLPLAVVDLDDATAETPEEGNGAAPQDSPDDHAPSSVVDESAAVDSVLLAAVAVLQANPAADPSPAIDAALVAAGKMPGNRNTLYTMRRRIAARARAALSQTPFTPLNPLSPPERLKVKGGG